MRKQKTGAAYKAHINSKFEQLKNCLGKAIHEDLFTLDQLVEALTRLNNYKKYPEKRTGEVFLNDDDLLNILNEGKSARKLSSDTKYISKTE